jgi:hypothetical protein
MTRRSFWASAMRVYLVVSGGSFTSPFGNLAGAVKQLPGGTISLTAPPFLSRLGIELMAGQYEIATPYRTNHFRPQEMDAVTECGLS